MFRKLLPLALVFVTLAFIAITGCSKKPSEYEAPENYSPGSVVAYPDTASVTIKWQRDSEVEAQSGFGGYIVYCTSRVITSASGEDSVTGLTLLPADSLKYFQVNSAPLLNTDSAVVTVDPGTSLPLKQGTKYYFYVRTIVDGQQSWAADRVVSSPRPVGYGVFYAYDASDLTYGSLCGFGFKDKNGNLKSTTYKLPTMKWRYTYVDSTYTYPLTTVRTTYSKKFVASDDSLNHVDSLLAKGLRTLTPVDTSVTGFVEWDSLHINFKTIWKIVPGTDTLYPAGVKYFDVVKQQKNDIGSTDTNKILKENIELVLQKVSGDNNKVVITCPLLVTTIPATSAWGQGLETFIQELPGGYGVSVPTSFFNTAYSETLSVGAYGNAYQVKTRTNNYAKLLIDSVVTAGSTVKVCFKYAYQAAPGIANF